ncbi:MAG: SDR family oxidoreductase [Spirochaetes bacterium]|nr:SDR family oxidoreductase [Spirochaetota bacterium]MBU1081778.1 SDR family oxidoreductase [Spirochaetota bacterium]
MTNNTEAPFEARLRGLSALIVGATGGIGLAIAEAFAEAGARLVMHGRDRARAEARASELRSLGADVSTICEDLSGGEPSRALLEAAASADILVVAYGPFVYKPLSETKGADWRLTALACLALPGTLATEAAAAMAARGSGRILLFGGTRTDAIRGFKANAAYAAAKTGIGVLAKSIAVEFGGKGVSCAVLCPGFVDTEYLDATTRERLGNASPRGGLIPSGEIARLALYLASGGMELANGSIIVADRGLYSL